MIPATANDEILHDLMRKLARENPKLTINEIIDEWRMMVFRNPDLVSDAIDIAGQCVAVELTEDLFAGMTTKPRRKR